MTSYLRLDGEMFVFGGSQGGGASGGASTDDNLCTRQHKKIKTRATLSQEEDSHSLQHGLQADAEPG